MRTRLVHRATAALMLSLGLAFSAPTGAAAVGVGQTCGGIAGVKCDDGLWCDIQAGKCGTADAQGQCIKVPMACIQVYAPVCGCDGKTYGNDCTRMAAKAQKKQDGPCK